VIGTVDENHFGRGATEGLGGSQAAEASTDNDNSWQVLIHGHKNSEMRLNCF
jgi:hypothetical protein